MANYGFSLLSPPSSGSDLTGANFGPDYLSLGPSGSSLDSGGSNTDWTKLLTKSGVAGAGALSALLAPAGRNINPDLNTIEGEAGLQAKTGQGLVNSGIGSLAPVQKYLQALFSGDPTAILNATKPQRARVVDQYDAARKSLATFSPRGGGQATQSATLETQKATDLSNIDATARQAAGDQLAQIGTTETGQGLTAQAQAQQSLAEILGPILQSNKQNTDNTASTWAGIATAVLPILLAL
jgi:hypothetical protein